LFQLIDHGIILKSEIQKYNDNYNCGTLQEAWVGLSTMALYVPSTSPDSKSAFFGANNWMRVSNTISFQKNSGMCIHSALGEHACISYGTHVASGF
jgi:hypothetical protein